MNSKEGVRPSRRFHLHLSAELETRLRDFARRRGMALATAIRELAAEGLDRSDRQPGLADLDSPVLVATLVAAEHAVLMVASILPEGERRKRDLAHEATVAAEERIRMVEGQTA